MNEDKKKVVVLGVLVVVMLGVAVWLFKDLRRHPEPSIDKGDRS